MVMMGTQQRPDVVTFVGIVLYISAAISAVMALVAVLNRNHAESARYFNKLPALREWRPSEPAPGDLEPRGLRRAF